MRGPVVLGMGWYRWERVGEVVGEGMGERGEMKEREKKNIIIIIIIIIINNI